MRQLELDLHVLDDLAWWIQQDRKTALRIIRMMQEIERDPFKGIGVLAYWRIGKPEPLKHELKGCWSRRITKEHRLIYPDSKMPKVMSANFRSSQLMTQ